jgi:hypothetical protein
MAIAQCRARRVGLSAFAALVVVAAPAFAANDYPTAARVDYVLACMASNGQDYITMERCSCSIDAIAETIPFEDYERIETILRMREGRGELALLFRTAPVLEEQVQAFKQAQVEADLRCF